MLPGAVTTTLRAMLALTASESTVQLTTFPGSRFPPSEIAPTLTSSGRLSVMCENSGVFADVISCGVFRDHEPIGTISMSNEEIRVFDNSGRLKEVMMYGGGKVSLR